MFTHSISIWNWIADASFCDANVKKQQMYSCRAKDSLIIEILWRWHNLLEKMIHKCIFISFIKHYQIG